MTTNDAEVIFESKSSENTVVGIGEVGKKSLEEEFEKINPDSGDEKEDEEEDRIDERLISKSKKMYSDKEGFMTKKQMDKEFVRQLTPIRKQLTLVMKYGKDEIEKIERAKRDMKKYVELIKYVESEKKRLKKTKVVNLEDFTEDELMGLKNVFNEKLRVYEATLREVNVLSDQPLEKAKVFRMARKIMMSTLNMLDVSSLAYVKLKILLEPSKKYGKEIERYYSKYTTEIILQETIIEALSDILVDNEESVNKLIDIFLGIVDKKESINYDGTVGLKLSTESAFDIYEEFVKGIK